MKREEGNGKVVEKTENEKANEEQRLKDWVKKILPEDFDKYDVHAKYDSTLTMEENKKETPRATLVKEIQSPLVFSFADAPACRCGGIMVRTGSCYTCPSCGENLGSCS